MCKNSFSYGDLTLINNLLLVNPVIPLVEKSASYEIYTCQYTANKPNIQVSRNTNSHKCTDSLRNISGVKSVRSKKSLPRDGTQPFASDQCSQHILPEMESAARARRQPAMARNRPDLNLPP
jgi:hypothetical protein